MLPENAGNRRREGLRSPVHGRDGSGTNFAMVVPTMDEQSPLAKVLVYQSVGFLAIIALTWLDELIALPSLIFTDQPFIFNFQESALKMLLVLAVWFLLIGSTRRVLARVRYLEGFTRVCSWCRRIHFKSNWISLEEFLQAGFDTPTTHGICPTCLAKNRAVFLKSKEPASAPAAKVPPPAAAP